VWTNDTCLEQVAVKVCDNIGNPTERHRPNIDTFEPLFVVNVPHLGPLKTLRVKKINLSAEREGSTYINIQPHQTLSVGGHVGPNGAYALKRLEERYSRKGTIVRVQTQLPHRLG